MTVWAVLLAFVGALDPFRRRGCLAVPKRADVVLGPVRALYEPGAPDWMRSGDFHATRPVWVNRSAIPRTSASLAFSSDAFGER